ncbi:hypothetical protein M514_02082 [Trichuris suis]|uniref:Uncharacterized protein n=1 Tax=Trichuris suis TaxID=68888 RepID=A0A085N1L4_9BILA|nr:hypothetical protein M513_02082 [Trichuris suis]KFD63360.1 hypothetical protein M514_02082 [Trichuris suis]
MYPYDSLLNATVAICPTMQQSSKPLKQNYSKEFTQLGEWWNIDDGAVRAARLPLALNALLKCHPEVDNWMHFKSRQTSDRPAGTLYINPNKLPKMEQTPYQRIDEQVVRKYTENNVRSLRDDPVPSSAMINQAIHNHRRKAQTIKLLGKRHLIVLIKKDAVMPVNQDNTYRACFFVLSVRSINRTQRDWSCWSCNS